MANVIPDEGTGNERIVVIDDCPGRWEEVRRRPCAGPAGGRMDEWLASVNLTRKDCFWMHVLQERFVTVTEQHLVDFYKRLDSLVGPVVLVPTGEWGLQALTGKKGLHKWRGSILSYTCTNPRLCQVKVIPTLSPSETFRSPSLERRCRFDWARIASDSQFSELRLPERYLHIRPTLSDVREVFDAAQRSPTGILAVDIETPRTLTLEDRKTKTGKLRAKKVYGDARITCVAFALAPGEAISVPTTLEYWGSAEDLAEAWRLIRALCACPIAKALQNGLFDAFYLAERQVELVNFVYDTMDMHHALDSTDEHSLAYIASTWTREPYWKDDGKEDDDFGGNVSDIDTFWEYNARDAAVTRELAVQLEQALVQDGLWERYLEHYPPLRAPLLAMMRAGIKRDTQATKDLALELKEKNVLLRQEVDEVVRAKVLELALLGERSPQKGDTAMLTTPMIEKATVFGPKSVSPKKLAWYLYDVLRIPKRTHKDKGTGTRKVTTDEVALRSIALTYPQKVGAFMPALLAYRRNDKLGSFVKEEVADADGYVRCSYRRATETHRLSSSKNPRRTGQNLQNVDREIRQVYVSDDGTVFVECDLSQAEDRVVKAYTGDPRLIDEARSAPGAFDTHRRNAAAIFQVDESAVTYDQRYLGKKAVHASNYGMHGKRLSEELLKDGYVHTPDECQRMIDRRLEAAPAIREWQQRTRMEVMRHRKLTNSWGWTLSFQYDRLGDDVYRRAYAYRPQSDIGILTNLWGLVPLHTWILEQRRRERTEAWRKTRLVLQVHDALVVCAPPETAYTVACAMRTFLEREHSYGGVSLTIPVEITVNRSWAKAKMPWALFPTREQCEAQVHACLS